MGAGYRGHGGRIQGAWGQDTGDIETGYRGQEDLIRYMLFWQHYYCIGVDKIPPPQILTISAYGSSCSSFSASFLFYCIIFLFNDILKVGRDAKK